MPSRYSSASRLWSLTRSRMLPPLARFSLLARTLFSWDSCVSCAPASKQHLVLRSDPALVPVSSPPVATAFSAHPASRLDPLWSSLTRSVFLARYAKGASALTGKARGSLALSARVLRRFRKRGSNGLRSSARSARSVVRSPGKHLTLFRFFLSLTTRQLLWNNYLAPCFRAPFAFQKAAYVNTQQARPPHHVFSSPKKLPRP